MIVIRLYIDLKLGGLLTPHGVLPIDVHSGRYFWLSDGGNLMLNILISVFK